MFTRKLLLGIKAQEILMHLYGKLIGGYFSLLPQQT